MISGPQGVSRRCAGGGTGVLVKSHFGSKNIGFIMVLARLRKFGWGAPAEGMTKVIPGLSNEV